MKITIWLAFFIRTTLSTDETEPPDRQDKIILFDVVKFPNDPCRGEDPFDRIGTCYSRRECRNKNGTAVSQCAEGYGVCCIFELDCGGKTSENITHFTKSVSEGSSLTGKCEAKVCRVTDNICQIRLDFSTFVLAGPSTDTRTTHYTSFGNVVGHSAPSRIAQTSIGQCNRDSFTARPSVGIKVPNICGINTGEHIYVDISDPEEECTTLAFDFQDKEITRQWNITITQISCDYENRAPPGCLQYHFGVNEDGVGHIIKSFNFEGGYHLASQNQMVCVRREANYCSICYSQVDNQNYQDFGISTGKRRACTYYRSQETCGGPQSFGTLNGQSFNQQRAETLMTVTGWIRGSFGNCGGYGLKGDGADFDFINVNKPVHAVHEFTQPTLHGFSDVFCGNGNFCGRNTSGPGICSGSYPFNLRFVSDSTEAEFEHLAATPNNRRGQLPHGSRGFKFGYRQRQCLPEKEGRCFQCDMFRQTGQTGTNFETSCLGPHFTRNKILPLTQGFEKVYQPYEGPTKPCDKTVYRSPDNMGTIKFPSDGMYSNDLNCYFKIEVSTGLKVKITFQNSFNMQSGVDYGISKLYPGYNTNLNSQEVNCLGTATATSCAACPNGECGGDCMTKQFSIDGGVVAGNIVLMDFCVDKDGITDANSLLWCHGNNDFLQVDGKSMFNYTDIGSAQNRFCGTDLPNIGGIVGNREYTSESNQLVLWFKSNGDSKVGTGFDLKWEAV